MLLARGIEEPLRQAVANAGEDAAVVLADVKKRKDTYGYNAATGEHGDLVDVGILDPTKVTRLALRSAWPAAAIWRSVNRASSFSGGTLQILRTDKFACATSTSSGNAPKRSPWRLVLSSPQPARLNVKRWPALPWNPGPAPRGMLRRHGVGIRRGRHCLG
jgi:hypothetical protein